MKHIAFFLLVIATSAQAQNYVITTKGDSLPGNIKLFSYDLLDRVQVNTEKKTTLTAIQIRSIFLNGETYKPARLGNAIRFMKVVKTGYLSLYAFKPENLSQYDGRMLIKMDGNSIEVPNLGFKKILIEFLGDCEEVTARIKGGEFARKDLESIIYAYNKCMGDKTYAIAKQATITETSKDKLKAIATLRSKIEKAKDVKSKDALELLADIEAKIKKGDAIPNYQREALKELVANIPDTTNELEDILAFLK